MMKNATAAMAELERNGRKETEGTRQTSNGYIPVPSQESVNLPQGFPYLPFAAANTQNFYMLPSQIIEGFHLAEPCPTSLYVPMDKKGSELDQMGRMYMAYKERRMREPYCRRALAHVDIAYGIYEQMIRVLNLC